MLSSALCKRLSFELDIVCCPQLISKPLFCVESVPGSACFKASLSSRELHVLGLFPKPLFRAESSMSSVCFQSLSFEQRAPCPQSVPKPLFRAESFMSSICFKSLSFEQRASYPQSVSKASLSTGKHAPLSPSRFNASSDDINEQNKKMKDAFRTQIWLLTGGRGQIKVYEPSEQGGKGSKGIFPFFSLASDVAFLCVKGTASHSETISPLKI